MKKGVIFDKDGTLVLYREFWFPVAEYAVDTVLSKVHADPAFKKEIFRELGVEDGIQGVLCYGTFRETVDAVNHVLMRHGYHVEDQIVVDAFHDGAKYGAIVPPCADLPGVLQRLREGGYLLFVVTSDDLPTTLHCLDSLGITEQFEKICAYDGVHPPKPDPYYIENICTEYGLKKSELLMVGDTQNDLNFAKNGGIDAVGVALTEAEKRLLEPGAVCVLHDVSGLEKLLLPNDCSCACGSKDSEIPLG